MTSGDDDTGVTPRPRLDDRKAAALLAGYDVPTEPELTALIRQVRAVADLPVPTPSTALAALLEHGIDPVAAPAYLPTATFSLGQRAVTWTRSAVSWRRRSLALPLQLSLAGAGCLALVLGVAATGALPAPAQTAVADVVEAVTPLHVPRPPVAPDVDPSPSSASDPAEVTTSPSSESTHPARVATTPGGAESGEHPSDSGASEPGSEGQSGDGRDQQGSNGPTRPRETSAPGSSSDKGSSSGSVDRPESGPDGSGSAESSGSGGESSSSVSGSGDSSLSGSGSGDSSGSGSGDSSSGSADSSSSTGH